MRRTLLFVVSTLLILSCKKNIPDAEPAASGPPTASGIGEIYFYDEFGNNLPPAGVKVSVDGTGISALSNSNGQFVLANVPNGTYDLSFSAIASEGLKKLGYSFVPGASTYIGRFDVLQKSTLAVTFSFVKNDSLSSGKEIYFEGNASSMNTNALSPYRSFVIFASKLFNVSPTNYSTYFYRGLLLGGAVAPYTVTFDENTNRISLPVKDFYALGYKKGERVYFMAAGTGSANFNPYYYNYRTQKKVFYALGSYSTTLSIVLP